MSSIAASGTGLQDPASHDQAPADQRLQVHGLTRSFGGHAALEDVSVRVATGEVVGLVGENGAGKSTLLNLLSGVLQPDRGVIRLDGQPAVIPNHRAANALGIFRLYQEPALLPNLSVYENVFLAHEERFRRAGLLQRKLMIATCRDILERFDHGHIIHGWPLSGWTFPRGRPWISFASSRCPSSSTWKVQ